MTRPAVSVLMPNYNHGCFLRESLDAILALRRYFLEIVVCDDASTDNSWEILSEYAVRYPVIRLIRNDKNLGCMKNIEKLSGEAKGDYLVFPAADDRWIPENTECLLKQMTETPGLAMYCGATLILHGKSGNTGKPHGAIPAGLYPPHSVAGFDSICPWGAPCVFIRRDIFLEFWKKTAPLKFHYDAFMELMIAERNSFYYLDKPLALFRSTGSNFSSGAFRVSSQWEIYPYMFSILKTEYRDLYDGMVRAKLFRAYSGVFLYLLCHPSEWDAYTLRILSSIPFYRFYNLIRHGILPRLFPESFKQFYRLKRDKFLGVDR